MDKRDDNPALGKEPRKSKSPKELAIIDQQGCTGCHACIPFCPVDCIEEVPGPESPDFMRVVEIDLERCIGCKLCAKYCPWETIFMYPNEEAEEAARKLTVRSVLYQELPDVDGNLALKQPEPAAPEDQSEPASSEPQDRPPHEKPEK